MQPKQNNNIKKDSIVLCDLITIGWRYCNHLLLKIRTIQIYFEYPSSFVIVYVYFSTNITILYVNRSMFSALQCLQPFPRESARNEKCTEPWTVGRNVCPLEVNISLNEPLWKPSVVITAIFIASHTTIEQNRYMLKITGKH